MQILQNSTASSSHSSIEAYDYTIYGEEVIRKAGYALIGYFTNYQNITTSIELKRFRTMSEAIDASYDLTYSNHPSSLYLKAYFKVITVWMSEDEYNELN